MSDVQHVHVSKQFDTVGAIKKKCCDAFEIYDVDSVQLWDYYNKNYFGNLESCASDDTFEDTKLLDDNDVVLLEQESDGTFPDVKSAGGSSAWSQTERIQEDSIGNSGKPIQDGIVGLQNLGNTCFMNSSLQCLLSVPPIVDHVLSSRYAGEINSNNPLGMQGKVAEAFAGLVRLVWGNKARSIEPRGFKDTIGQFAPQFNGFQQHDSQELLNFLLDGLHEDLNRIVSKPTTKDVEAHDRPDEQVAQETWERHRLRNDSVVMDLMAGQYRSTVRCNECHGVSVTFDPYTALSLPLQVGPATMTIHLTFVPRSATLFGGARSLTVTLPALSRRSELQSKIAQEVGLSPDQLLLCEVQDGRIPQLYMGANDDLTGILDSEHVFAYEVDNANAFTGSDRRASTVGVFLYHSTCSPTSQWPSYHGSPVVMEVPEDMRVQDIYAEVEDRFALYLEFGRYDSEAAKAVRKKNIPMTWWNKKQWYRIQGHSNIGKGEPLFAPGAKGGPAEAHASQHPESGGRILHLRCEWTEKPKPQHITLHCPSGSQLGMSTQEVGCGGPGGRGGISLADCLDNFRKPEQLGADVTVFCRSCEKQVEALKTMQLWSAPQVLVVQLKRFKYTSYSRSKLDCKVDFPLEDFDMSDYIVGSSRPGEPKPMYTCVAVSNHLGGLGGGHYTAYVRSAVDGSWYSCDDAWVKPVNREEVVTHNAYVLFYMREDVVKQANWGKKLIETAAVAARDGKSTRLDSRAAPAAEANAKGLEDSPVQAMEEEDDTVQLSPTHVLFSSTKRLF